MHTKTLGRIVAVLFLTHATFAPLANFVLPPNQAALVLYVIGLTWVGIALAMHLVLRPYSESWALAFFAVAVAMLCGLCVEGIALHTGMPTLRRPAHYMNLLMGGVSLTVFYAALYRFSLIPRVLSGFGLVTAAILITGALIPLLGNPVVMLFFMPIGLSQLALILWLAFKGFVARPGVLTP